ncbi:MAG: type III-B CRISPR module-associated protein Cmr5 [Acidimicrobiaceae bacterium]|nr:type III-B CRISPR module-associated protein Cmr5 [Acidimicrobiaceae bacterium]
MNLAQRRAKNALERTKKLNRKQDKEFKKNYLSYVDRLGPAIVMNGLGQALATERAAAGPQPENSQQRAHHELYRSLKQWLCGEGAVYESSEDLLEAIIDNNEILYLRAQAEALAWLEWHKKFTRAYFPTDNADNEVTQ